MPTLLARYAWSGGVTQPWNRNYTLAYLGASPCTSPLLAPGKLTGSIVAVIFSSCDTGNDLITRIGNAGGVAVLRWTSFSDVLGALYWLKEAEVYVNNPISIPVVYATNIGPNDLLNRTTTILNTGNAVIKNTIFPLGNANNTYLLTPPVFNPLWAIWETAGSNLQFSFVCNIIVSVITCVVSFGKLLQFLHLYGPQFSFPQVSLSVAFLGGVSGIFLALTGYFGYRSFVQISTWYFLFPFNIAFACTLSILMGMYFGEVSRLTSAQSVPGLGFLFWPAVGLISLTWIMIIVSGSIYVSGSNNLAQPIAIASFSFLAAILGIQLIVCVWGSIFLLKASSSTPGISRVVGLSLMASVFLTGFGLSSIVLFYFVISGITNDTISIVNVIMLVEFGYNFVPCICILIITLNFRITVSKAIELSKSGTSSTVSSSSSSKTSSSSSADPVIEL